MKVMYSVEQKRVAVATYRRYKSYVRTLRLLGYPSHHVLFDWARGSKPGRRKPIALAAYHKLFGGAQARGRQSHACRGQGR